MDKYIGKKIEGRYEIQEMIGMGGMANVYKAYDFIDQRTVAVKILRDEYLDNEEFLRRFKNESKAIAVLSHPNIVRVYDVSFTNRVHSIVMEYIDGITLKEYIERQGTLHWKDAVHFTLQILHALQHAHDKGIVHRDIKPQNIMLLEDGTIKVTDFGIALFARSEVRTITDRAIGSVHYISPEQAMGGNTDEKSDIYSVGVMLFEMLTGKLPFVADTAVSVAIKQINTQAVLPRSINPEIPEGLEEITMKAMQKEAKLRYSSAAGMIADIERFQQNPSILFEYKYMTHTNPTANAGGKEKRTVSTKPSNDSGAVVVSAPPRTPYLPILTGVTLAFVLASAAFILLMIYLNNPFATVPEDTMPNLVGLKLDTVMAQYGNIEVQVELTDYNDDQQKGYIFDQSPKPGTAIKVGSVVKVKVSDGQKEIDLPDFTGKTAAQTISKLKDLGLEPKEERIFSAQVAPGSVIYTNPSKDTRVTSRTVITVYVSKGPEIINATVPDLAGLTLDGARRLLEQKKFALGKTTEEASEQPAGTVIRQSIAAGALEQEGTTIDIVVSKEGLKRYTLAVPLPSTMDRIVLVRARTGPDGENIAAEERINPKEEQVWRPIITGEQDEVVQIKIYVDTHKYLVYLLDFSDGSLTITEDRRNVSDFMQ